MNDPERDLDLPGGIFIPENLEECFAELKRLIKPEDVEEISCLQKFFVALGLHHADDMSGVILSSFWLHLNGRPLEVEKQVKHYQDYWKKYNENKIINSVCP